MASKQVKIETRNDRRATTLSPQKTQQENKQALKTIKKQVAHKDVYRAAPQSSQRLSPSTTMAYGHDDARYTLRQIVLAIIITTVIVSLIEAVVWMACKLAEV